MKTLKMKTLELNVNGLHALFAWTLRVKTIKFRKKRTKRIDDEMKSVKKTENAVQLI